MTVSRMMADVLVALLPIIFTAIYFFKWYAVKQLLICVGTSLLAEALLPG